MWWASLRSWGWRRWWRASRRRGRRRRFQRWGRRWRGFWVVFLGMLFSTYLAYQFDTIIMNMPSWGVIKWFNASISRLKITFLFDFGVLLLSIVGPGRRLACGTWWRVLLPHTRPWTGSRSPIFWIGLIAVLSVARHLRCGVVGHRFLRHWAWVLLC